MRREFRQFLRDAPVGSGVCMCGGEIGTCRDHSSVDMWDHSLPGYMEAEDKLQRRISEALVRLAVLENNAALQARWEQLQAEVGMTAV